MHPNPAFHDRSETAILAFACERGFGALTIDGGAEGPLLSHVPFVLCEEGDALELHLVRSGPLARRLAEEPAPALLAVAGADAYVSPDWYGLGVDQVPTWNYVAAHIRGEARLLDAAALRDHLDRLSARFEERLRPKPPWSTAKMSETVYARMMRAITPARIRIESVAGTWKLNQNKPAEARALAAEAMAESPIGGDPAEIARLMRADLGESDAD